MKPIKPRARSMSLVGPEQEKKMQRADRNRMKTYEGNPGAKKGRVFTSSPRKRKSYGA